MMLIITICIYDTFKNNWVIKHNMFMVEGPLFVRI